MLIIHKLKEAEEVLEQNIDTNKLEIHNLKSDQNVSLQDKASMVSIIIY